MTDRHPTLFADFDNHRLEGLPASSLPSGKTKREVAPATHLILDDMLPKGWRYRADGARSSWRAVAWARDGRYIEARARTWQHALAELTRKVVNVRSHMEVAPPRPEGYEDPPTREHGARRTEWIWPIDVDDFLESICFGRVTEEQQRRFLARFMTQHSREFAAMPPVLRKELAIRRVLPGSYWPAQGRQTR